MTGFLVVFCLALLALACGPKQLPQISISGEIKNLPKGLMKLNLEEDINRKKSRLIAEIPVDENGRFRFSADLMPHIYTLKVNDKKSATLAIDKGQNLIITGDVDDSNPLAVSGSDDTAKLEAYEIARKESLNRLVISIRDQIKDLKSKNTPEDDPQMLELAKLELENYSKHKAEMIEFVKKEMGTSIAVYATSIRWDGDKNIGFLNELEKQFEIDHPDLDITAKLKEKIRILTASSLGGNAPEIAMPDKDGKLITLSSLKAKYILVDFWGSWCGPCRRESGELSDLYRKYQSQGFEIYGVGLESQKDAWLRAIEQDKRTWTNVSTFEEFETPTSFDYGVTSLPANFLIDSNGKVIDKNIHGEKLRDRLKILFVAN